MPDLYLPFDTCEPYKYQNDIKERKNRRGERKQRQQERTEALAITNNSASFTVSNSQLVDITSSVLRISPKPMHSASPEQNKTKTSFNITLHGEITDGDPTQNARTTDKKISRGTQGQYGDNSIIAAGAKAGNTVDNKNPFKRQLTDKFSAEKINGRKKLAAIGGSRIDSTEQDKTRLSFPSDFSQVAANAQQKNTGFQVFRRSGTMREQKEKNEQNNNHRVNPHQIGVIGGGRGKSTPPLQFAQGHGGIGYQTQPNGFGNTRLNRRISPMKSANSMTTDSHRVLKKADKNRLCAFQNLPIKGQMKMHRPLGTAFFGQYNSNQAIRNYSNNKEQRLQAQAEAIRLLQNKNDMFERYLKKPSTTSVGFLVLDKMNSVASSRQQAHQRYQERQSANTVSRGRQTRNSSQKNHKYEIRSGGGGVISDNGKSPMLSSSKNDLTIKDRDMIRDVDGDSFAVSLLQTTFDKEHSQDAGINLLRQQKKFDTLSTDQASLDCNKNSSTLALAVIQNNLENNIQSASVSMTRKHAEIEDENIKSANKGMKKKKSSLTFTTQTQNNHKQQYQQVYQQQLDSYYLGEAKSKKLKPKKIQSAQQRRLIHVIASRSSSRAKTRMQQDQLHQSPHEMIGLGLVKQKNSVGLTSTIKRKLQEKTKQLQNLNKQISRISKQNSGGGVVIYETDQPQRRSMAILSTKGQKQLDKQKRLQGLLCKANRNEVQMCTYRISSQGVMEENHTTRTDTDGNNMVKKEEQESSDTTLQQQNTSQFGVVTGSQGQVQEYGTAAAGDETLIVNQSTDYVGHRPQTGKIESSRIVDNNSNSVASSNGRKRLVHNQTICNNDRKSVRRQEEETSDGDLASQKYQGLLTQAKIDKRRSMQKGSRFAYALELNQDQKKLRAGQMSTDLHPGSSSEHRLRGQALTPAGNSLAITGPSTLYNNNLYANANTQQPWQSNIPMPEGLTCFGNPTLETLKIQKRLPTLELQIQQVVRRQSNKDKNTASLRTRKLNSQYSRQQAQKEVVSHDGGTSDQQHHHHQLRILNSKTLQHKNTGAGSRMQSSHASQSCTNGPKKSNSQEKTPFSSCASTSQSFFNTRGKIQKSLYKQTLQNHSSAAGSKLSNKEQKV